MKFIKFLSIIIFILFIIVLIFLYFYPFKLKIKRIDLEKSLDSLYIGSSFKSFNLDKNDYFILNVESEIEFYWPFKNYFRYSFKNRGDKKINYNKIDSFFTTNYISEFLKNKKVYFTLIIEKSKNDLENEEDFKNYVLNNFEINLYLDRFPFINRNFNFSK